MVSAILPPSAGRRFNPSRDHRPSDITAHGALFAAAVLAPAAGV